MIDGDPSTKVGLIAYGGTHFALVEARDQLRDEGIATNYCRIRALPCSDEVTHFIERHLRVYVVEQNRDAQVTAILKSSLSGALADRLIPITHYNGTPLAAQNIVRPILSWEKSPPVPAGRPAMSSETTHPCPTKRSPRLNKPGRVVTAQAQPR